MTGHSCILIGNESLAIQCGEMWLEQGHGIAALVTHNPEVAAWGQGRGLRVERTGKDLDTRLGDLRADWLLSIANLTIIPGAVLARAARGAINFHDGPLPRYAGLNAPVWAILNREPTHGITWHMIEGGIDEGDIVAQAVFDLGPEETALTLNTKCYAAAMDSFSGVVAGITSGDLPRQPQDLSQRSYFARDDRPAAAARLDLRRDTADLVALVRGLDHGAYWNPLAAPKIEIAGRVLCLRSAAPADLPPGGTPAKLPGAVLGVDTDTLTLATGDGAITLGGLTGTDGQAVALRDLVAVGDAAASLDPAAAQALSDAMAAIAPQDAAWRRRLRGLEPADLPQARPAAGAARWTELPLDMAGLTGDRLRAAVAAWAARIGGKDTLDLALGLPSPAPGYISDWVPAFFDATGAFGPAAAEFASQIRTAVARGGFACDIALRDPQMDGLPCPRIGISDHGPIPGTGLCVLTDGTPRLAYDETCLDAAAARLLAERLEVLAAGLDDAAPIASLPIMSAAERQTVLTDWNRTDTDTPPDATMATLFEAQVAASPDATALVFEGESLTYAQLNARANRLAHVLRDMGVGPDVLVGLFTPRSVELMVGALAIHKAGGAYVPLDPAFPADRIALYVEDSKCPVIVAHSSLTADLPAHGAQVLVIDTDPRLAAAPQADPAPLAGPENLAYVIYTSGSTGRPKGVMVEHRNVSNFFTGMDDRVPHPDGSVWLAVTSLSFDISVLELFWTLARGFKLVISSDEDRALISSGRLAITDRGMDFSLFYWGNDDGIGPKKYELLLEGAKIADRNGFTALWTPERHFHAFGGPYPNPSVTGAAVAAVTDNLEVRAGSCVAPLHHPARIAEEWAVIDNLTNGRTALAIASGWQPDDFVLRPENTPPRNKAAMMESIDILRRLWRGEAVEFPTSSGTPHAVVTQPRPVSKELKVWVTTAGNPQTWKEAGEIGANVLTHLLGQSVDEVAGKIRIYHQALRDAGHDPKDFKVTLMLHTFVGASREAVREIAREPMKDYLRAAAGLIKQYAWAFPAFKRPEGVKNPFELDLESLDEAEMEGILDFAFQRYFEDSGLFGTIDDCLARVEQVKRIGVDEIACLIDYGIPVADVLEGLTPLSEVLRRANQATAPAEDDFSIAAQILRHGVTHMQCTPSMARMIAMNDEARYALSRLDHLLIGGEALPGALVSDLRACTSAAIENMYGPTETTIWSSTETAAPGDGIVNIGRPIANTQLYVLDEAQAPVPIGVPGELYIGGLGVTRGYLHRPDLTQERFLPDPFRPGNRMYRTGDLVRWREDGRIDFFGRADNQVKIRGYRIELGEIEARLNELPAIREAVVIAREDQPGDVRLVAYLTVSGPLDDAQMRSHLRATLPDYMVPAHFVQLDAFPLTPNKKVDRKALPAPSQTRVERKAETYTAPADDTQEKIAEVWKQILGLEQVGARDNFFDLGGHSLLAVQAHRALREALGASTLSITDIFRFPVLSALADHISGKGPGGAQAAPDPAALAQRAEARTEAMSRRRAMRAQRGNRAP